MAVDSHPGRWAGCVSVMTMNSTRSPRPAREQPEHRDDPAPTAAARLNRAAVVLWRSRRTVQLELGDHRIVVENLGPDEMSMLLAPPGDDPPAGAEPAVRDRLAQLTSVLDQAGFLTRAAGRQPPPARLPARLSADAGALTAQFGSRALPMLQARRAATVAVHGTSRLAASLAAALAAAGVGWIQLVHGGEVTAGDACPGGLAPGDEGRRFAAAADEAVRRYAPDTETRPIPPERSTDLVVLTDPGPPDASLRSALHQQRLTHLPVTVDGQHAVVGPLVVPGVSSCLRCADLHRTDRDPAWPALAVQLAGRPRRRIGSDVALCVATVGVAAGQALSYLDQQRPAALDGTLEWQLPDWRLRRRTWPAHHRCDCGAAAYR